MPILGYTFNKASWTWETSEVWLHLNNLLMDVEAQVETPTELIWYNSPPVPGVEYVRVPAGAFQVFALRPAGQAARPRAKGRRRR